MRKSSLPTSRRQRIRRRGDRDQAYKFAKAWFHSIGNYFGFYNDSNPLVSEDGTAIVWILGMDSHMSCLSEELVRAGLVEVDVSPWEGYTFTVPTKADDNVVEDWQGILREAKKSGERGEPPEVLFKWPPT